MRSTSLFSLFGIALCMSAAVVACSGDDDDDTAPAAGTPSDLGQSCTRTADCKSGLVCIDQVCEKSGTVPNAGAGNEGSGGSTGGKPSTGGSSGMPGRAGGGGTGGSPVQPVLGGEGESCTRAADCQAGLHCFNQRCTSSPATGSGGEGGMGPTEPPSPKLGERGETCVVSSDCATGLLCLPGGAIGGVGVCTIAEAGITPTGYDCHAECRTAVDCCQLPPNLLSSELKSCSDLEDVLSGVDCTSPGSFAELCFIQATYCKCTSSTWKCDAGLCEYTASCENDGLTTKGCPAVTRSNRALPTTDCNDGKCQVAAVDPTCTSDADCDGKGVFDDTSDTCSAGECTCYKAAGVCYRKCSVDLDCAAGKTCDTKSHVCMPAPECTEGEDVTCQNVLHNVNARCVGGSCKTACQTDLDCNSTLVGGLAQVCNADHLCEAIGCTQDSECSSGTNPNVHMFCTPKLTAEESTSPASAVTDGK